MIRVTPGTVFAHLTKKSATCARDPEKPMTDRMLPDPTTEPTVTAARWATVIGVSTRAVLYAVERGEIPALRVGRAVRILTARAIAEAGLGVADESAPARPTLAVVRRPGAA